MGQPEFCITQVQERAHSQKICSGYCKEVNWCWVWKKPRNSVALAGSSSPLSVWSSLICCKRNMWCLNWWILKCHLVCGWGQFILHCWGCRCSWMVHNYSLKKLQTIIEPTQTPFLLTAHAKLSATGNDSVVILQCTCTKATHSVKRRWLYF